MFYTETFRPRYSELDRSGLMFYDALLGVLENAAGHHSENSGDFVMENHAKGISWILVEWRVRLARRPHGGDCLNVRTWVRGKANSSVVYRDFIVSDADGAEIVRAEAKFVLMDMTALRLTRIGEERFLAYRPEEELVFESDAPRLRPLEEYETERILNLRKSDFDINCHVHNTKYMDFVAEAIPGSLPEDGIAEFRLACLKPIVEQDGIVLNYAGRENAHFAAIRAGGNVCALCELIKRQAD